MKTTSKIGIAILLLCWCNFVAGLIPSSIVDYDYCLLNKYCSPGTQHIACLFPRPKVPFGCTNGAQVIEFNQTSINLALDVHNTYRNKIAAGLVTNGTATGPFYPKAARMLTVRWDNSFAYFAESNTRQFKMKHDACLRSIDNLGPNGQNLYAVQSFSPVTVDKIIKLGVDRWFNESQGVANPTNYIQKSAISHFSIMISDNVDRIGCAMSTMKEGIWNYYFLACNYYKFNVPVYKIFDKKSECTKQNPKYPSLCFDGEKSV